MITTDTITAKRINSRREDEEKVLEFERQGDESKLYLAEASEGEPSRDG